MAKRTENPAIDILEIQLGQIKCHIVGTAPMIMHRFGAKAVNQLLLPAPKKNAAERATTLKHDPVAEFRESIYMNRDPKTPAAIHVPTDAFGKAIADVALDVPGAKKAQLMRLTSIADTHIDLFGLPRLGMDMVRSSDQARTPDVRTRAYFPRWACALTVRYVRGLLKENQIVNLLGAAGMIRGIGDWRPQKGGSHGTFKVVPSDDPEYLDIVKKEGRKPQLDAIAKPVCFDSDSEELLAWFHAEIKRRERDNELVSSGVRTPLSKARRLPPKKDGNGAHLEA